MLKIKCKCGETQNYNTDALPVGKIEYWRCPKCKTFGEGIAVKQRVKK